MTKGDTKLKVQSISKRFGQVIALKDVSFSLRQGEFLTMLGPSGSGKTTTLRAIAGFNPPDTGSIRLAETDVAKLPPNKRNIGMVFQDYALFPHLSIAQNVGFPLEARGVQRAERKRLVDEMIGVVGLAGMEGRMPRQLSGGQQQRVALARALVFKPELVLLDEPLAALDKKLRMSMQLEILRITRQVGATVISVTHDQEEALVMSDRIALFSKGELAQIGKPEELYRGPKSRFVADFIGEANLIEGNVENASGKLCFSGPGFVADVPDGANRELRAGDKACLVIRPESLRVHTEPDSSNGLMNRVAATVRDIIYLGVECKVIAEIGQVPVQVRSRDLSLMQTLQAGKPVKLTWNPEDAIFLPSSQ
ncbi:ABC transporter ATP-binding protein [Sinorhizobium meliloti]|uniref:ABC transporter ATP-binding protein n=1 Tax=Rhizobium meliloti TaxID=382 RepID=UPI0003760C27|nr:ABC transporter ATP-binding protein [Sinorhizobium meliloti]